MPWTKVTALFAAGIALLSLTRPALADDANLEEARTHFRAGVAYLEDPEGTRYEEAYAEFKKTYEISKSPKVLGNIGLCAMKLERDGEAIEAYQRYLAEVPDIDPEERAQIERDLPTLKASVVHVRLTLDIRTKEKPQAIELADTRIPIRGASIVNTYGAGSGPIDLAIRPGHHRITANVGGHARGLWDFSAEPGTVLEHTLIVDEAPAPPPTKTEHSASSTTGPVLLMGLGGAALVAGGVLGVVSLNKVNKLEEQCPNDACTSPTYQDDVDSARGFVTATDILLIGGGVVAAVGVSWFFLTPDESQAKGESKSMRATASCNGRGCDASLHMRF